MLRPSTRPFSARPLRKFCRLRGSNVARLLALTKATWGSAPDPVCALRTEGRPTAPVASAAKSARRLSGSDPVCITKISTPATQLNYRAFHGGSHPDEGSYWHIADMAREVIGVRFEQRSGHLEFRSGATVRL